MITLNRKLSTQLVNCAYKYSVVSHNCVGEVLNRQSRSIHGHNQASLITSNGLHQVYSKGLLNCIPNYGCLGQTRDLSSIKYIPLLVADFISNSWPVQKFTESLIWIHDVTGLQWYSSIILSTLIFRTLIVFPFVIYNEFIDARLAPLGPIFRKEVDKARVEIGEMVRRGELEPKLAKPRLRELMYNFAREKYIEHNVHPGQKFVLIAFQLPLWMFMSFALGNMTWRPTTFMSMDIRESMAEGGTLWFLDLTQVDPFCILPVINFLLLVFAVQHQNLRRIQNGIPDSGFARLVRKGLMVWFVFVAYIGTCLPSGVVLYWVFSGLNGNLISILLTHNKFRRLFKLPPTNVKPFSLMKLYGLR